MALSRLFIIHAVITFAAGVVLIVAPQVIPATVGITLDKSAYLLCYLLGASELCMAYLSYRGRQLDAKGRRLICATFIIFHLLTAGVELYAIAGGSDPALWANIALRIVISGLFLYYGFYRSKAASEE
jgi:hypothetical protein